MLIRAGPVIINHSEGHASPPPPFSPLPELEFLFVVDICFTHGSDLGYLYPRWNFSSHCLANYLIELRHIILLPFQYGDRKGLVTSSF